MHQSHRRFLLLRAAPAAATTIAAIAFFGGIAPLAHAQGLSAGDALSGLRAALATGAKVAPPPRATLTLY